MAYTKKNHSEFEFAQIIGQIILFYFFNVAKGNPFSVLNLVKHIEKKYKSLVFNISEVERAVATLKEHKAIFCDQTLKNIKNVDFIMLTAFLMQRDPKEQNPRD